MGPPEMADHNHEPFSCIFQPLIDWCEYQEWIFGGTGHCLGTLIPGQDNREPGPSSVATQARCATLRLFNRAFSNPCG